MAETLELMQNRGFNSRVEMAGVTNGYAGSKINIAVSLDIPDFCIVSPVDEYRGEITLTARNCHVFTQLPVHIGLGICCFDVTQICAHGFIPL